MAVKSVGVLDDGVYRIGVFEGAGISERSGKMEMRLRGEQPMRPDRITLKYKVNPFTGDPITAEGLVPGVDRVCVRWCSRKPCSLRSLGRSSLSRWHFRWRSCRRMRSEAMVPRLRRFPARRAVFDLWLVMRARPGGEVVVLGPMTEASALRTRAEQGRNHPGCRVLAARSDSGVRFGGRIRMVLR